MSNTLPLASRWKRLGGAMVDAVIGLIVIFPIFIATGLLNQIQGGQPLSIGQQVSYFILGTVLFLILHGYLLAKRGQTIGKLVVGTKIVSVEDGQILPLPKLFGLRYLTITLGGQIPVIGQFFNLINVLFIFRSDKRCIHDLFAGTVVVDLDPNAQAMAYDETYPPPQEQPPPQE